MHEQHFPSNIITAAIKQWVTSTGQVSQAFVHRWQKCIANSGAYVEKWYFEAENLLCQIALLCFSYHLEFPWR